MKETLNLLDKPTLEDIIDILQDIFGNILIAVIKTIKEKLAAFEDQQPIFNFLIIMRK